MIETLSLAELKNRLSRSKKIPLAASLEITYACNLACVHCYNPTHKAEPGELNLKELFSILDNLAKIGCLTLTVTGGEIFAHPHLFEILDYAQKLSLQLNLFTNATLLTPERLSKLKQIGPNLISVSVYGITCETYEKVTRVSGSFEKFMTGVSLLKTSGLPLLFKMPVMTLNAHELHAAQQWFHSQNLKFIHSVEIHPRVDGSLAPLEFRLSPEETAKLRIESQEDLSCALLAKQTGNLTTQPFSCSCGKTSAAITPYGEMNLCVTTPFPKYSLKAGSLKEGWNVLVDFVKNFHPSEKYECPTCELSPFCSQGSMDAFLNTGDFNPCLPYFKETASQVKHLLEEKNVR